MNFSAHPIIRAGIRRCYKFNLSYIQSRRELPHILNARGLLGEGAEIGVLRGIFSALLLNKWKGSLLYSIDPWKEYPAGEYRDNKNVSQDQHDRLHLEAVERLKRYGDRSMVIRKTSEEAVDTFRDGQLDFVYIDAQHHYEAIREDIFRWYKKVKKGGILAGHDYLDGFVRGCQYGVKSAVDEFAKAHGLRLALSRERMEHISWFLVV